MSRVEDLVVGGGAAWVRQGRGTVSRLDASGAVTPLSLPFSPVSLSAREDGRLWVGGDDGRAWIGDLSGGKLIQTPLLEGRLSSRLVRGDGTERWFSSLGAVDVGPPGVELATDGPLGLELLLPIAAGGVLYGVDATGGVAGLPGARRTVPPGPSIATPDGRRYVLADGSLWRWDAGDATWARVAMTGPLGLLAADGAGTVWLAGQKSLWRLGAGDQLVPVALVPLAQAITGGARGGWLLTQDGVIPFDEAGPHALVKGTHRAGWITGVVGPDGAPWWCVRDVSVLRTTVTGLESLAFDGKPAGMARAPDGRVWILGEAGTRARGVEPGARRCRLAHRRRAEGLVLGPRVPVPHRREHGKSREEAQPAGGAPRDRPCGRRVVDRGRRRPVPVRRYLPRTRGAPAPGAHARVGGGRARRGAVGGAGGRLGRPPRRARLEELAGHDRKRALVSPRMYSSSRPSRAAR
jgi:hypothetical protein